MVRTAVPYSLSKSNPLTKASGMNNLSDRTNWAVNECADAERGDWRRTTRLVELANVLGQHPTAAFPEACGEGGMLNAAYRFVDNDAIAPQAFLQSHVESTYSRLAQVPVVVAVPESPEGNGTRHPATEGLGPWGHKACQGLFVHRTLAFTPARVPLGLLAQQVWARAPNAVGKRARRTPRPIRQQESQTWRTSLEAVCNARDGCPTTRVVSVGDREADVYDVLAAERPEGVERLIRASGDRCVSAPARAVWATVATPPVVERLIVQVPRRGPQPARDATLARRCGPLTWSAPRHRQPEGVPAVALWAVQVAEVDPPEAVEPIEGRLLTTVAGHTVEAAIARVEWYACRWGSEVWQRMLNSGCRVEARQLATGARLQRGLTRYRVMAWRMFDATRLARAVPEMPCRVRLDRDEWHARYGAIPHGPTPPEEPPALDQALRWLAPLGGCVGRRRRDQPGAETLWRGFHH
jgi:hypothetical protein